MSDALQYVIGREMVQIITNRRGSFLLVKTQIKNATPLSCDFTQSRNNIFINFLWQLIMKLDFEWDG